MLCMLWLSLLTGCFIPPNVGRGVQQVTLVLQAIIPNIHDYIQKFNKIYPSDFNLKSAPAILQLHFIQSIIFIGYIDSLTTSTFRIIKHLVCPVVR
jgi:hypothetical protein